MSISTKKTVLVLFTCLVFLSTCYCFEKPLQHSLTASEIRTGSRLSSDLSPELATSSDAADTEKEQKQEETEEESSDAGSEGETSQDNGDSQTEEEDDSDEQKESGVASSEMELVQMFTYSRHGISTESFFLYDEEWSARQA